MIPGRLKKNVLISKITITILYALIGTAHLGSHHIYSDFPGKVLPLGIFLCVFGGRRGQNKWFPVLPNGITRSCYSQNTWSPFSSWEFDNYAMVNPPDTHYKVMWFGGIGWKFTIINCPNDCRLCHVRMWYWRLSCDCVHHTVGACERKQ